MCSSFYFKIINGKLKIYVANECYFFLSFYDHPPFLVLRDFDGDTYVFYACFANERESLF